MKRIEVVAAIIRKDDKIFATQRGYGEWKDWWEFPGGKMEVGETPEEALVREIREELSAGCAGTGNTLQFFLLYIYFKFIWCISCFFIPL